MSDAEEVSDAEVVPEEKRENGEPDSPAAAFSPPGEAGEVSRDLVRRGVGAPPERSSLFGTDDPVQIIRKSAEVAGALKDVLAKQNMISKISGRDHVKVEGWQTTGVMLGVSARVAWSRPYCDPVSGEPVVSDYEVVEFNKKTQVERRFHVTGHSWEARVEVVRADGEVIAAGEAMCSRNESTWAKRDDFSLRSMAQTRATSKALRGVLGFIVTMAGYEASPAEEMPPEQAAPSAGAAASDELSQTLNRALAYMLGEGPRVDAVRTAMIAQAGGYLSAPMSQGALFAVKAYRDHLADAEDARERAEAVQAQQQAEAPDDTPEGRAADAIKESFEQDQPQAPGEGEEGAADADRS